MRTTRQFLFALLLVSSVSLALMSITRTVRRGAVVPAETAKRRGWPKGVLEIVNDPVRTDGWNTWFSGTASDVHSYHMEVVTAEDVQRLVDLLSEIEADKLRIVLSPERGAKPPHLSRKAPTEDDGAGVVFAIGSQATIDAWFGRLRIGPDGKRLWGKQRLDKPHAALPPTLTLYVGSRAMDLDTLLIPLSIEVSSAAKPSGTRLDEFVARHKAARKGTTKKRRGDLPQQ